MSDCEEYKEKYLKNMKKYRKSHASLQIGEANQLFGFQGRAFHVLNNHSQKTQVEPYVFHMQHLQNGGHGLANVNTEVRTSLQRSKYGPKMTIMALSAFVSLQTVYAEEDLTCINFYTVGESDCRPAASTPVARQEQKAIETKSAKPEKSPVDEYLDNYGKPPREFVEFYLNPTTENANKWMKTYRGMMQKGEDISHAWQEADQLYKAADDAPTDLPNPTTSSLEEIAASTTVSVTSVLKAGAEKPVPVAVSIGAFSTTGALTSESLGGVRVTPLNLTYYFSQTCPYCARMTPDLSVLIKENKSKLVFTCVDVTPISDKVRPSESFITSKLPCIWRLPEEGEVEREGVGQTPTLLIQKEGGDDVRLSGYVPLAQLRRYF